jgi:hypothetical protein
LKYTKGGLTGLGVNISELAGRASSDISGLFGSIKTSLISSMAFRRALEEEKHVNTDADETASRASSSSMATANNNFSASQGSMSPWRENHSSMSLNQAPPEPQFTTEEIMSTEIFLFTCLFEF